MVTTFDDVVVENSLTIPTATPGDNTTKAASTAFVGAAVTAGATPDATTSLKGKVKLAGDLAGTADLPTVPALAGKQPTITPGTVDDYYRGDKTFQPLSTTAVPEGVNLYFTDARAQAAVFSRLNYITNPNAETDTVGWNLYDNSGRTVPAYLVNQSLTFTSALAGNAGNGVSIQYVYNASFPSSTPNINVISPTSVQVRWSNGPTIANNPTPAQLKAAWDAVPAALAIATVAITGDPATLQYINGGSFSPLLGNGGDTAPINGTGGVPTGLTFTRNTTPPVLVGNAEFVLTKDATSQMGSGVSTDFEINQADKGNTLQLSFYYSAGTGAVLGTQSDTRVFLYDITNDVMLPLTPRATLAGPTTGTIYRYAAQFDASDTSVNYRLILHTATANATAWALRLDEITVNAVLDAAAATSVPQLRIQAQPISGAVTDRMAVMWLDGASAWTPATMASGTQRSNLYGFAVDLVGLTADIVIRGDLDGFSVGPFLGYNQYVGNTAGSISPLPSPFTDTGVVMGKGTTTDTICVNPEPFTRLVTSKGGLLSNAGANNGTGDQVLAVGANGNVVVANSGSALGLLYAPAVVAAAPFTYTLATRTLTIATATDSVAGVLSAADHTTYTGYAASIALKANLASPTFTGVPAAPTAAAATSTTQLATTAFVTTADNLKANLASPTFTGTPTLPTGTIGVTQVAGNSTTALATTAFVTTADNLKAPLASPTFTGDVNASTGNVLVSTIGKGLQVKTGTNAKIGTAVLVGGTATVANTSVTANSRIFLTSNTDGGTVGAVRVSAKVNGTSFTITSLSALDTSTIAWMIVESIP